MIAFVTHQSRGVAPSARLKELQTAEAADHTNDFPTYRDFARRIEHMKGENLAFLSQAKTGGKRIYGFGAPVKGNTLLNYFKIGTQYLDCLVEKNELRRGLYSPGMHIPVVIEHEITQLPNVYYVLAWNFKKEILANNQHLIERGVEFFFPVNPKEA